jgi:hypothetical protein
LAVELAAWIEAYLPGNLQLLGGVSGEVKIACLVEEADYLRSGVISRTAA